MTLFSGYFSNDCRTDNCYSIQVSRKNIINKYYIKCTKCTHVKDKSTHPPTFITYTIVTLQAEKKKNKPVHVFLKLCIKAANWGKLFFLGSRDVALKTNARLNLAF